MSNKAYILVLISLVIILSAGCFGWDKNVTESTMLRGGKAFAAPASGNDNTKLKTLDDIADKRVGVYSGTVHDAFVAENYPQASILRYDSTADMILSLKSNKIDVAMLDYTSAKWF